ncbi:hypothetical protein Ancab_021950 [Ancistrocladus abbreviatus]
MQTQFHGLNQLLQDFQPLEKNVFPNQANPELRIILRLASNGGLLSPSLSVRELDNNQELVLPKIRTVASEILFGKLSP